MKNRTLTMQIFLSLMLMLGVVGARGQRYNVIGNYSGFNYYTQELKDTIGALVSIVDEMTGLSECTDTFKIFSMDLSSISQSMKKEDVDKYCNDKILEINNTYNENIIIIRKKQEQYLKYQISIKLPTCAPFDTVTISEQETISSDISALMDAMYLIYRNNLIAEVAGILLFKKYIVQIGTKELWLTYDRFYYKLEKECIPLFKIKSVSPPITGREEDELKGRSEQNVSDWTSSIGGFEFEDFGEMTLFQIIGDINSKIEDMNSHGIKSKVIIVDHDYDPKDNDPPSQFTNSYEKAKQEVVQYDFGLVVAILWVSNPIDLGDRIDFEEKPQRVYFWVHDPSNVKPFKEFATNIGNPKSGRITINDVDNNKIEVKGIPDIVYIEENVKWDFPFDISVCPLAFGYVISGNISADMIGWGGSIGAQRVVFIAGDYAWYPYDYVFYEISNVTGGVASANISYEFGIYGNFGNNCNVYYPNPRHLAGEYDVLFGLDVDSGNLFGAVNGGITLQCNIPPYDIINNSEFPDSLKWASFTIGGAIGIGIDGGLGGSLRSSMPRKEIWDYDGTSKPWAKAILKTKVIKTSSRGWFDKAIAWTRFVGGGGELALSSIGKFIMECLTKGK